MSIESQGATKAQQEAFSRLIESPRPGYGCRRSTRPLTEITQASGPMGFVAMSKPLIEGGLSITSSKIGQLAETGLITMDESGFIQLRNETNGPDLDYGIVYHFGADGRLAGEDFYCCASDRPLNAATRRYQYDPDGQLETHQWGLWRRHLAAEFQYREERYLEEEPEEPLEATQALEMIEEARDPDDQKAKLKSVKAAIKALNDEQFVGFGMDIKEVADGFEGEINEVQETIENLTDSIEHPGPDDDIESLRSDLGEAEQDLIEIKARNETLKPLFAMTKEEKERRQKASEPAEIEKKAVMEVEMRAQMHGY